MEGEAFREGKSYKTERGRRFGIQSGGTLRHGHRETDRRPEQNVRISAKDTQFNRRTDYTVVSANKKGLFKVIDEARAEKLREDIIVVDETAKYAHRGHGETVQVVGGRRDNLFALSAGAKKQNDAEEQSSDEKQSRKARRRAERRAESLRVRQMECDEVREKEIWIVEHKRTTKDKSAHVEMQNRYNVWKMTKKDGKLNNRRDVERDLEKELKN